MRNIAITASILILAALTSGCPAKTSGGQRTPNAVVELKVDPPDAAVIVDGRLLGNAWDLPLLQLTPGEHLVEIRKAGYEPFVGKLDAGPQNLLQVQLKRKE